jgi:cytochrome c-type biogenesis protein CcmF
MQVSPVPVKSRIPSGRLTGSAALLLVPERDLSRGGPQFSDDGQKQMVTAYLAVFADGKQIDTLYPAKWFFRKHEQEPTTEVAIRRTLAEDLYVTLGGYEVATQVANLEIHVNPLVN